MQGDRDLTVLSVQNQIRLVQPVRNIFEALFEALYGGLYGRIAAEQLDVDYVGIEMIRRKFTMSQPLKSFDTEIFVKSKDSNHFQWWRRLHVQLFDDTLRDNPSPDYPRTAREPLEIAPKLQKIALDSDSSAHSIAHSFTSQVPIPQTPIPASTNLSRTLEDGKRTIQIAVLGPDFHGWRMRNESSQLKDTSLATLHTILGRQEQLRLPDKVKLALTLCVSVIHLYSTPWLKCVITSHDVLFVRDKHASGAYNYYLDRPFLTQYQSSRRKSSSIHLSIFSLGVLLLEIGIGCRIPDLVIDPSDDSKSILEKHKIASRKTETVTHYGGATYAHAVQWCLDQFLRNETSDGAEFEHEFYEQIVNRMEKLEESLHPVSEFAPESGSDGSTGVTPLLKSGSASKSRMSSLDPNMPSSLSADSNFTVADQPDNVSAPSAHASWQDDDTRSQYTTTDRLSDEKARLFTSEFADTMCTRVWNKYSQDTGIHLDVTWIERLHAILPEVLRGFAIQLGHDVLAHNSGKKREVFEVIRFIHGNRQ